MKPTHTRLTCRAHNRFSPSIALWQHFVGVDQPFLSQQRPSSNVASAVQHRASKDAGNSDPQVATAVVRPAEGGAPTIRKPVRGGLNIIKKYTRKGEWHTNKADASIAKNVRQQHATRQAESNASEKLLAVAREAYEAAEDYEGVVVEPMVHPTPVKEDNLPWSLPLQERGIPGIERLAIEIERFCKYSQPGHYETIARRHVVDQVRNHVRQTLPDHVLELFGSERTGLTLATSDIDFRLLKKEKLEDPTLGRLPPTPKEREEAMKHIHKLHWDGLLKHKAYLLPTLRYARYPLISIQDRQSGLDLQIVLSNDTSLSREIMKGYMEQYPYLRQLYFVVKTMFDVRGLTDVFRGGFGSYTLFMMVVASIRHMPHPREDVAGALINFMKFYRNFDTTKKGLSIEPVWMFEKSEQAVLPGKAKWKIEAGKLNPLPEYMLCLRDPADATNDLGRRAIAIRHVQATFKALCYILDRDMRRNTRISLLAPLVGSSYMLYKERRHKLAEYGKRLSDQMKKSLAVKARMIREGVAEVESPKEEDKEALDKAQQEEEALEKAQQEKMRLVREERDREWRRLTEERNKKLSQEAERTAVLKHGDVMPSILGMPSIEDDTDTPPQDFPVEEANPEAEKRSINAV